MKEFRVDSTVAKRLLGFCGELTSIYLEDPLSVRQLDYSELSDALSQHRNLMERPLIRSGESRKNEWELGWKENFELLQLGGLDSTQ
jgi:hypothetical protein